MHNTSSRRTVIAGAAASAVALCATPLRGAEPTIHEVNIQAFVFDPPLVEVRVGDIIRWINRDLAPHTATADERGWGTAALSQGATGDITVATPLCLLLFLLGFRMSAVGHPSPTKGIYL